MCVYVCAFSEILVHMCLFVQFVQDRPLAPASKSLGCEGGCKPSHHHHSPYPNPRLHTGAWFKLKGRWYKEKWRWRPLPYSTPHLTCVSLEGVGHTSGEGWGVGDVVWWWVVANTCLHTQRHYTLLGKEVPPISPPTPVLQP